MEKVKCECGKSVPVDEAIWTEDGWICAKCYIDIVSESKPQEEVTFAKYSIEPNFTCACGVHKGRVEKGEIIGPCPNPECGRFYEGAETDGKLVGVEIHSPHDPDCLPG